MSENRKEVLGIISPERPTVSSDLRRAEGLVDQAILNTQDFIKSVSHNLSNYYGIKNLSLKEGKDCFTEHLIKSPQFDNNNIHIIHITTLELKNFGEYLKSKSCTKLIAITTEKLTILENTHHNAYSEILYLVKLMAVAKFFGYEVKIIQPEKITNAAENFINDLNQRINRFTFIAHLGNGEIETIKLSETRIYNNDEDFLSAVNATPAVDIMTLEKQLKKLEFNILAFIGKVILNFILFASGIGIVAIGYNLYKEGAFPLFASNSFFNRTSDYNNFKPAPKA